MPKLRGNVLIRKIETSISTRNFSRSDALWQWFHSKLNIGHVSQWSKSKQDVHQSYLFSMFTLYNPVSVNEIVTHRNDLFGFFIHVTNVCDRLKSENKR